METVLRRSLFKAQFLEQEPVVDQGLLLGSAIFYPGQQYYILGQLLGKTSDRRECEWKVIIVQDAVNPRFLVTSKTAERGNERYKTQQITSVIIYYRQHSTITTSAKDVFTFPSVNKIMKSHGQKFMKLGGWVGGWRRGQIDQISGLIRILF